MSFRVCLAAALVCVVAAGRPCLGQSKPASPPASSPSGAAGASAHEPRFDDKQLWPGLSGQEFYPKQKWEKVPLYVWAHPGVSAMDRQGRKNAVSRNRDPGPDREEPQNWLVDGKPAEAVPGEQEVDLLLPASDKTYSVSSPPWKVRHVTIESGAAMVSPNKGEALRSLSGNMWIKTGGRVEMQSIAVVGANNAFFRNDNRSSGTGSGSGTPTYVCYWMTISKPKGSLEFIGDVRLGDELKFNEGVIIVSPDSTLLAGPPSTQIIGPDAVLELQSGATFGKHSPTPREADILIIGELRAGSPQRPLTKDATLGLNVKPVNSKVDVQAALAKPRGAAASINRYENNSLAARGSVGRPANIPDGYSLAVSPGAKMRVYSADPTKARLRIAWNHVPPRGASTQATGYVNAYLFSDDIVLDGVVFDNFFKGGIHVLDAGLRDKWKHVTFGEHNQAKADELFDVLSPTSTAPARPQLPPNRNEGD